MEEPGLHRWGGGVDGEAGDAQAGVLRAAEVTDQTPQQPCGWILLTKCPITATTWKQDTSLSTDEWIIPCGPSFPTLDYYPAGSRKKC